MPSKEQTHGSDKTSSKQRPAKPTLENLDNPTHEQIHPAAIVQRAILDSRTVTPDHVLQLQRTIGNRAVGQFLSGIASQPVQRKEAKTGLPANLKAGIENLSGLAMDDVQVTIILANPLGCRLWHSQRGRISMSRQGKNSTCLTKPGMWSSRNKEE